MEQIAVVKITKTSSGEVRRNMMLPKDIWEKIVAGDQPEKGVSTYELRQVVKPIIKETKIIQDDIKEVELIAEKKEDASPVKENESDSGKEEETKKRSYNKRK